MRHHHTIGRHVPLTLSILLVAAAALAVAVPATQAQTTPAASLDQVLKGIASYDGGIDSAAFWSLREYVEARKDDPAGRAECESKLLQFLKTPATPVARMAAARHLRVIAGDTAVPALQVLLKDERTADPALYVLRQIPGPVADKALLQALGTTAGATRIAVIGALGGRRTMQAVPTLVPLLKQPALARPAAIALGAIGGEAAGQALLDARAAVAPELRPVVAGATLQCAESLLAAKNDAAALRLYDALSADASLPVAPRKGAALGRIAASGVQANGVLMELLNGSDPVLQEAAIAKIKDLVAPADIAPVCAAFARLPERGQVQLLAVLSGYPREGVLPTVLQAGRSAALPVRLAALKALESTGDASVVPSVVEQAVKTRGAEQAAARATLGMLKGRAVDEAILAQLAGTPAEAVQGELLLAVADRRIFSAKKAVAAAVASDSSLVRRQGLKALRVIGTPSDAAAVLDLLVKSTDEAERAEAEATVAALTQKTARPEMRAIAVKARLAHEKDAQARVRLIGVLPTIGDGSTLAILRTALADPDAEVADAAVRALTAWPTAAARDDVLRLARESKNETHKLLAIGALVRLISLDRHRDPAAAVADLKSAAGFAWRPEEQRLVLGALVQFPCADALQVANGFLQEASVKAEAAAAVEKIQAALK